MLAFKLMRGTGEGAWGQRALGARGGARGEDSFPVEEPDWPVGKPEELEPGAELGEGGERGLR